MCGPQSQQQSRTEYTHASFILFLFHFSFFFFFLFLLPLASMNCVSCTTRCFLDCCHELSVNLNRSHSRSFFLCFSSLISWSWPVRRGWEIEEEVRGECAEGSGAWKLLLKADEVGGSNGILSSSPDEFISVEPTGSAGARMERVMECCAGSTSLLGLTEGGLKGGFWSAQATCRDLRPGDLRAPRTPRELVQA